MDYNTIASITSIGYLIIGVLVYLGIKWFNVDKDGVDEIEVGFLIGLAWPIAIMAGVVWMCIKFDELLSKAFAYLKFRRKKLGIDLAKK